MVGKSAYILGLYKEKETNVVFEELKVYVGNGSWSPGTVTYQGTKMHWRKNIGTGKWDRHVQWNTVITVDVSYPGATKNIRVHWFCGHMKNGVRKLSDYVIKYNHPTSAK